MLLADLIEYTGFRGCRTDAVDCDVEVCSFFRDRFSQSNDPCFGSTVSCSVGITFFPCDGSHIDNSPIVLLAHDWNHGTTTVIHGIEVDVDDMLPVGDWIFPRWDCWTGDPCVVHQNVDTTDVSSCLLNCCRDSVRISYIYDLGKDWRASQDPTSFLKHCRVLIPQADVGA